LTQGQLATKAVSLDAYSAFSIANFLFFIFPIDRRNGKAIINSHTQVEVPEFEPRSWRLA